MSEYNSELDTLKHIKRVNELLVGASSVLLERAVKHDASKLRSPEKDFFDRFTPLLKSTTYGSEEYWKHMEGLKEGLAHHYENNSHHPEHYTRGINGMDLFDIVEMFFDWKAASERHEDGDIMKSIQINKRRFDISDQLVEIFENTANRCF